MKKSKLSILLCVMILVMFCGCGNFTGQGETENTGSTEMTEAVIDEADTEAAGTEVSQGGPFGRISVTIPEGWKYELCPVDSGKLVYGLYGIQIYPENVTVGCIELCYVETFGVCGTGLEEETIVLAGDSAWRGTYDNHAYWDFVSFRGKNEGVVAQTISVASWWEEAGEHVSEILDTLRYEPEIREGAASIYYEDSEIYEIGLMADIENISATGATILYHQYNDSASGTLEYGEEFIIEKLEKDTWVEVPVVVEGDYAFTMVAYEIKPEEIAKQDIDWEWLYGELKPGEYRIGKSILDFRASGDFDEYMVYVHFILN